MPEEQHTEDSEYLLLFYGRPLGSFIVRVRPCYTTVGCLWVTGGRALCQVFGNGGSRMESKLVTQTKEVAAATRLPTAR